MRTRRSGALSAVLAVAAVVIVGASGLGLTDLGGSPGAHPSSFSRIAGGSSGGATVGGQTSPLPTPGSPSQPAASTPAWKNITAQGTHPPPPRVSAGMVYDSTDGYLLLFGGEQTNPGPTRYYNDTWKFANGQWTNLTNSRAPAPRFGFLLADDPADHAVVLFGGEGAAHPNLNDTWEYKAGTWINVTSGGDPPLRFWGSMSYDTETGNVLLFGGEHYLPLSYSNDTWSFHAGNWTRLTPPSAPSARDGQNQVDDVADHEVVVFGGLNSSDYLNDTWAYSAGTWAPVTGATAPDDRTGVGMAYDAAAQAVVMYGGYPAPAYYSSTWVFHAGTWTRYALNPTPDAGTEWGQMGYDAADQYVVLFQGNGLYNSTWELNFTGSSTPPLSLVATATPLSGPAPLPVMFAALASGGTAPYSYLWSFGDLPFSSSPVENTTHTYATAGAYTAMLNVTDSASGKVTQSWDVTVVAPLLVVTIAATPLSTSVDQNVTFTSTVSGGTPPYTFLWNFGDHEAADRQNATHPYAADGTYLVVLTVHDSAVASVSRNVTITVSSSGNNSPASSDLTYWILLAVLIGVAVGVLAIIRRRRRQPPAPAVAPPPVERLPPRLHP